MILNIFWYYNEGNYDRCTEVIAFAFSFMKSWRHLTALIWIKHHPTHEIFAPNKGFLSKFVLESESTQDYWLEHVQYELEMQGRDNQDKKKSYHPPSLPQKVKS